MDVYAAANKALPLCPGDRASSAASHRSVLSKAWLPPEPSQQSSGRALEDEAEEACSLELDALPVHSALDACIRTPVLAQYRLTSRACLRLLLDELHLLDVCHGIRCVMLGGEGGFLQRVVNGVEELLATAGEATVPRLRDVLQDAMSRTPLPLQCISSLDCKCASSA
jgi:hypothetical protein